MTATSFAATKSFMALVMEVFALSSIGSLMIKLALYLFFFATNSALNSFPFSGTIAASQYLSVIPSQPFELLTVNFYFSISS